MTRIEEFQQRLDALLEEFSDLPLQDIANTFDYYASDYQMKATREAENEK